MIIREYNTNDTEKLYRYFTFRTVFQLMKDKNWQPIRILSTLNSMHLKWQMTKQACTYNKQNVLVAWCDANLVIVLGVNGVSSTCNFHQV